MLSDVRYHVLRTCREGKEIKVAFTCLLSSPEEGVVYCGIAAGNMDILHAFDCEKRTFRSLGYQEVGEPYECKVHRSLVMDSDGTIYGATACLHNESKRRDAPGGALFRVTPGDRKIEKLCVPSPPDYIQNIAFDGQRRLIYGFTYPVSKFFVYHIDTGEVEDHDYIGSRPHLSAVDDHGRLWGTWGQGRNYLFCYDPDTRGIRWTETQLPGSAKGAADSVDSIVNGRDGFMYIGSNSGALFRLDPNTADAEWLGKPSPGKRMPGLHVWRGSMLLGVTGADAEDTIIFSYDRATKVFRNLGVVADDAGEALWRPHYLAIRNDSTIYVAETDVPGRSGYLWEATITEV